MVESIKNDLEYIENQLLEVTKVNNICKENIYKPLIGNIDKKIEELEQEFIDNSKDFMLKYYSANNCVFDPNDFKIIPIVDCKPDTYELIDKGFIKGTLSQRISYWFKKKWYSFLFILFLFKIYIKKKYHEFFKKDL